MHNSGNFKRPLTTQTTHNQDLTGYGQIRRLCIAYNTSVQPTKGFTQFYLMYGRQVKMPRLTKPTSSETIMLFSTIETEPGCIYQSQREANWAEI